MQTFHAVLAVALLVGVSIFVPRGVQSIGVCYGVIGDNLPPRGDVVRLYKSNGITDMRIYKPDSEALNALRGSGIGVVLGIADEDLTGIARSSGAAGAWVMANVRPYYPSVNIKYIVVGNELAGEATQNILPAMQNLAVFMVGVGLGGIKVTTAVSLEVITNSFPPSKGEFAQLDTMKPIVKFLANIGAPLLANVYPYFAYKGNPNDINLNYATFKSGTTVVDGGNGLIYTNLFSAMVDAIIAALEKAGAGDVRIVVSESGWPSAGGFAATVENAVSYNQGFIDNMHIGTPKRPWPMEAYLFAVFNENQKPGELTERNFGLFNPNMSPVYPIIFR